MLAVSFCPECRIYLGVQPTSPELPALFVMPHYPWCQQAVRDERERVLDELADPQLQFGWLTVQ